MIRYTTPTLVLRIPADIHEARILVTLRQGLLSIDKEISGSDVSVQESSTVLTVRLSQEETGKLLPGRACIVQANWVYPDGTRNASREKTISIMDNLKDEVMSYA